MSSAETKITYASFWERTHAFILDNIIFLPFMLLHLQNLTSWKQLWISLIPIVAWCIYKPVSEWKYGQTWGKKIVGIKILDAHQQSIDFNQAMLRFSPYFGFAIVNTLNLISLFNHPDFLAAQAMSDFETMQGESIGIGAVIVQFLFTFSVVHIFFSPEKQAHHDGLAQTYCVKV